MRTIIDIPDDLCQQAESEAAREGIPVDHLIAQALRLALRETPRAGHERIVFPLIHSSQPGTLGVSQVQAAEEAAVQQEDAARARAL